MPVNIQLYIVHTNVPLDRLLNMMSAPRYGSQNNTALSLVMYDLDFLMILSSHSSAIFHLFISFICFFTHILFID